MNQRKRILVVDDERWLAELLSVNLIPAGFDVIKAYDGQEGLSKVNSEKPDLVILDVLMPDIDGFEVCRRLKASESTRDIPVIMLSAYVQPADIQKGLSLGAASYMTKPFDIPDLIAKVKRTLRMD